LFGTVGITHVASMVRSVDGCVASHNGVQINPVLAVKLFENEAILSISVFTRFVFRTPLRISKVIEKLRRKRAHRRIK